MSRKVKDRLKDILVETDILQKIKIEVKNKKGLMENEFLTRTREEYLEYKEQLATESSSESYLIRTKQQEELDITIAKDIIKQYPNKFQHIAIAEVKDIIGASDRALELGSNSGNISPTDYVSNIVNRSVPQQSKDKNQLTFE